MPLLFLHVAGYYLPKPHDAPAVPNTPRHKFTHQLLSELDLMVAQAIIAVDSIAMGREEVAIYPTPVHPWARNTAEFCFDLQPGNGGLTRPEHQHLRRARIADLLGKRLDEFFDEHTKVFRTDERPSFDVECRPLSGSGHHHDFGGRNVMQYKPIHRWGQPVRPTRG